MCRPSAQIRVGLSVPLEIFAYPTVPPAKRVSAVCSAYGYKLTSFNLRTKHIPYFLEGDYKLLPLKHVNK